MIWIASCSISPTTARSRCRADPSPAVGKPAVREALAGRFAGLPDVHYGNDTHLVAGDVGVSRWTVTGTTPQGLRIEANGCDFYSFRDGQVIKKDSYWKIVEK
jgi:ketosteroid isomerase-like protein